MHTKTLAELSLGLRQREYSSVELTKYFLERITKYDNKLNSFITVSEDTALAEAVATDKRLAAGEADILTGIPLAHKDLFCTNGIKTSCGSKMLDNFVAPYDATVVAKCKAAGMVMLGKTNMDEFAMGSSNETSFYGSVKNPWNINTVPGGSSGGSVVAVAASLTPIATGTDTGGSIRQPSALCGVTGLKPTYGVVSRYGMVAFASSLDQGGPIGHSAEDVALLLNVMSGFDKRDSTSIDNEPPDYTANLNNDIKGLKIGLIKEHFNEGLDTKVNQVLNTAIKELEQAGAIFQEISLPHSHLSVSIYYIIALGECSSNLSRYDGVRFGHRCEEPQDLLDMYKRSRAEGFGAEVKRRIMLGTYVLSAGYYDAYYLKAQQIRRLISEDFKAAFKQVDVILGPTAPTTAFEIGAKMDNPISMYLSDIYTISCNLAGLPAMSIPAGFADNLPVGLHLVGNHLEEAKILNVAHKYQQITDWHQAKPTDFV